MTHFPSRVLLKFLAKTTFICIFDRLRAIRGFFCQIPYFTAGLLVYVVYMAPVAMLATFTLSTVPLEFTIFLLQLRSMTELVIADPRNGRMAEKMDMLAEKEGLVKKGGIWWSGQEIEGRIGVIHLITPVEMLVLNRPKSSQVMKLGSMPRRVGQPLAFIFICRILKYS